jgi:hypothetical protein
MPQHTTPAPLNEVPCTVTCHESPILCTNPATRVIDSAGVLRPVADVPVASVWAGHGICADHDELPRRWTMERVRGFDVLVEQPGPDPRAVERGRVINRAATRREAAADARRADRAGVIDG